MLPKYVYTPTLLKSNKHISMPPYTCDTRKVNLHLMKNRQQKFSGNLAKLESTSLEKDVIFLLKIIYVFLEQIGPCW